MAHFYDSISNRRVDPVAEEEKLNSLFAGEERYYSSYFNCGSCLKNSFSIISNKLIFVEI